METSHPQLPSHHRLCRRPRIILGVSGSVAAIKAPELAVQIVSDSYYGGGCELQIVLTKSGEYFWDRAAEYNPRAWKQFQQLQKQQPTESNHSSSPAIPIHHAHEEWQSWERMGDPVSHIALRDWADLLVIAPCSAHSLAKFVHGLCDDLLSSIVRAWPFPNNDHPPPSNKPMILVPAMNTGMWEHPLTRQQLETMQRHWATTNTTITDESTSIVTVVPPQSKLLACGESGMGAMAPIPDIVRTIQMTWKQTVVRKDDDRLDSDLKSKQKFTYQGA